MKKLILTYLIVIMLVPVMVNAVTCDTDKITIENITIENKIDNVEELDEVLNDYCTEFENDFDLPLIDSFYENHTVYVVDNELYSCLESVEWPEWKPNVTNEERQDYENDSQRASELYDQCYINHKKLIDINDRILDS